MACSPQLRPGPAPGPAATIDPNPADSPGERSAERETPRLDPAARCGSIEQLDALAAALASALHRMAPPIAIAASEACHDRAWTDLGYARAEDFARERLGRTGRWLRDMAALGRSSWSSDRLLAAVEGSDGKPPLGSVAGVAIARFAPPSDALPTWIGLGRAVSVRELRQRLRQARTAGSEYPVDASGQPDESLRPPDPIIEWIAQLAPDSLSGPAFREAAALPWNRRYLEGIGVHVDRPAERSRERDDGLHPHDDAVRLDDDPRLDEDREPLLRLRIDLPAPVVAAFHEARRLHARVVGRPTSTADFTDALVAEARASGLEVPPDMNGAFDRLCAARALDDTEREAAWDRRRRAWPAEQRDRAASGRFPLAGFAGPDLGEAAAPVVARAGRLAERAVALRSGVGDTSAMAAIRRLQALLALEQELRRTLGDLLAELRARRAWRALGFESIRHFAEARLGMSRSSVEDAALLARALPGLPAVRQAWEDNRLSFAAALRVVRILGLGREAVPAELERFWAEHAATTTVKRLDDERALLRERRLLHAGDPLAPVPDADWNAALERAPGASAARLRACARLAAERSDDVVPLLLVLPFSRAADFLGALDSAARRVRTFSAELAPFDARWLGLLALLTAYAAVHDEHRGRAGVYARDGWRCRAPGCTAHANLEDHHVRYRSRDGDDTPDNRVTLCRFHHQRGEHGGGMRVVGRAPLDLDFTLDGQTYRNERRIGGAAAPPGGGRSWLA
jgi:hypothetical protein